MATISVPGAGGSHLIFTVTGESTINYATAFAAAVNSAESKGKLTLNVVNGAGKSTVGGVVLNELVKGSKTQFTPTTGQYTVIDETASVTGSVLGHDTVLAGMDTASTAGPFSATYTARGSDNRVTFISGNNTYDGSTAAGAGGDTITAGSGSDVISTGTGSSTVFSGVGTAFITLNDTVGGDVAYLGDGKSTVIANGISDIVAAASPGQLIIGGSAGDSLAVAIQEPSSTVVSSSAGDVVVARGSATTVFDSVGGNTIFGGTGNLTFVGQSGTSQPVSDTILTGSGSNVIVGFSNADITFGSTSTSGGVAVIAGTGNETLNGANATSFNLFADTAAAASSTGTFVGSYDSVASDTFLTGAGNETFISGNASDLFELDTVSSSNGPAHITIFGFGGSDLVGFGNDSVNAQSDLNSGTVTAGNLTITLSDKTTVTFVGVTSLTGHTIT